MQAGQRRRPVRGLRPPLRSWKRAKGDLPCAGHLRDIFRTLTPANDLTFRHGINAPTVRVEDLTVAGV